MKPFGRCPRVACIKPPANVTEPEVPAGPTGSHGAAALAALAVAETLELVSHFDLDLQFEGQLIQRRTGVQTIRGMHHVPADHFTMHVQNPDAYPVDAREVVVDVRSGNVRADLHVKDSQGNEHSKSAENHSHTFTNPELSQIQVLAEIWSAFNDPQATVENNKKRGTSESGVVYEVVSRSGRLHGWPVVE